MTPDEEDDLLDGETGDDESGDGEDQASLALNTPEPARALQAGKAPKDDAKTPRNRKGKFAKAKEGAKSALSESFVVTAYQGLGDNSASTAIQVTLNAAAFGLEVAPAAQAAAPELQELSAFDRDEIADPEASDEVELLAMLAGMHEKPWENEKLSVIEQMMLKQGYERNLAAIQRNQDQQDPAKKSGRASVAKAAGVAAAVVVGATAAGIARVHASGPDKKGPSMAGVSQGPRREADQDRAQIRNEAQKPAATQSTIMRERQRAEDIRLRQLGTGLAASALVSGALATGAMSKMDRTDGRNYDPAMELLNELIRLQERDNRDNALDRLSGNPANAQPAMPAADSDARFQQTMNMLYTSLGPEAMTGVSPYRQAGWEEKRLEQKENSADITTAPPAPEPKTPAPEPANKPEFQMNLGPGGM
jgi:hypothetical protein